MSSALAGAFAATGFALAFHSLVLLTTGKAAGPPLQCSILPLSSQEAPQGPEPVRAPDLEQM